MIAFINDTFAPQGIRLPASVRIPERKGAIAGSIADSADNLWVLPESVPGATR